MMHQRVWKMKTLSDTTRNTVNTHTRTVNTTNHRTTAYSTHSTHSMHSLSTLTPLPPPHSHDLEEPKTWQTRSDLQTYLGALAVMGRQKGGGRVFSKEKHSYFDHDDDNHTAMQQHSHNSSKATTHGRGTTGDDGEEDDTEGDVRLDRGVKRGGGGGSGESREEEKQQHEVESRQSMDEEDDEAMDDEAEFSVPLGASADISSYITQRLESRQRERTIDITAPPATTTQYPSAYSTRGSIMAAGGLHASFLGVGVDDRAEHKEQHFSPRHSLMVSRSGAATPHLVTSSASSHHTSPQFYSSAPRSPASAHTPLRLHAATTSPASLDAQALSLVTSIHFHHSEQMRQLHYTGGKQLVRRTAAVVEGKNLFAGLKDKFHNTFTEIREMAEEDREDKRREQMALLGGRRRKAGGGGKRGGKSSAAAALTSAAAVGDTTRRSATSGGDGGTTRRPATTSSASTARPTARPTLPSASGFRPATSAGLIGRQSTGVTGGATVVERRTWPDAFVAPDAVDTFTRLAPIVRLPRQGNVADNMAAFSLASKPTSPAMKGMAGRRASVSSAPVVVRSGNQLRVPAPLTTGDLSALSGSMGGVPSDEAGSLSDSARGAAGDGESAAVARPPSVYKQQQHTHMRANFIRFLSHTEPQLWTPTPPKRRDGEQISGRNRGKSKGARASVIQTHSGSPLKAG